jgi:hypothetical protein
MLGADLSSAPGKEQQRVAPRMKQLGEPLQRHENQESE